MIIKRIIHKTILASREKKKGKKKRNEKCQMKTIFGSTAHAKWVGFDVGPHAAERTSAMITGRSDLPIIIEVRECA